MRDQGSSRSLERHYALSDFPIAVLSRELDRAYPISKFILTIRDPHGWPRGERKHSSERNPHRARWDADRFTHQRHQAVYGRRNFDQAVCLPRYRRHNQEVLEYVADWPNNLLVMNMNEGGDKAGWPELCGFLYFPIPNVPHLRPTCV